MGAIGSLTQIPKRLNRRLGPRGMKAKNHFVAMVGEFIGTTMFLFFAFAGTQIANLNNANPTPQTASPNSQTANNSTTSTVNTANLMFIALAFGFSLMVNVWVFFRISGGLFNPAISLALALVKIISPFRAALLVLAQVLGGITAAALVNVLLPESLYVRTTLGGGISVAQGLFLEMFMTAELVFVVFMLAAEKHKATFLAPVGIGIALFMAEMAGVYYTGGSLNPARSLGPDVVLRTFDTYAWIYWVGPILGAFLATGLYLFMKVLDYEGVNGDQDKDELDITLRENPNVVHHKKKLSRPVFSHPGPASYMHGGHIGEKQTIQGQGTTEGQHIAGDQPIIDGNSSSSEMTAVHSMAEQNGVADLGVPGDGERTSLSRPEQMV